jgi:hypothetical protein
MDDGELNEVEPCSKPFTWDALGWQPHLPLPSGAFLAAFEAHTPAHVPTRSDEQPAVQHADINHVLYQHAPVRRPHVLCRGTGKGGMRAGRRKKSKKKRMEAALMGFRPSVRTDCDPLVFDPMGFCTPQHKR